MQLQIDLSYDQVSELVLMLDLFINASCEVQPSLNISSLFRLRTILSNSLVVAQLQPSFSPIPNVPNMGLGETS